MTELQHLKAAVAELETSVLHALSTGDSSGIEIMGYGEISVVVALDTDEGRFACKRLPLFEDQARFDNYAAVFEDYLKALHAAGANPIQSELISLDVENGIMAYCVQPGLDPSRLGPKLMLGTEADTFLPMAIAATANAISSQVGIDAQLSNWALVDDELIYIDVTTPFLRNEDGTERLDLDLFLASLPWALRGTVRKFLLTQILGTYYVPRSTVVDTIANMIKEGLDDHLDAALAAANEWAEPPITEQEVRKFYKTDARTWALLQRVRLLDRFWQQRVRRRVYPFLLPGPIKR